MDNVQHPCAVVNADELYQALKRVAQSSSSRAVIPILSYVKVEIGRTDERDSVRLTCTDLEVVDFVTIQTPPPEALGAFCVPVKLFRDIASRLREIGEPVTLSIQPSGPEPSRFVIECGTAVIRLVGKSSADFPLTSVAEGGIRDLPRPQAAEDAPTSGVPLSLLCRCGDPRQRHVGATRENDGGGSCRNHQCDCSKFEPGDSDDGEDREARVQATRDRIAAERVSKFGFNNSTAPRGIARVAF